VGVVVLAAGALLALMLPFSTREAATRYGTHEHPRLAAPAPVGSA
jgi:hypothetical protein